MIKTIITDLGGVYFSPGTYIAINKINRLLGISKQKLDEVFETSQRKEGFLYRKGKLAKNEFWKRAAKKLKIRKNLVPKLQKIWHSSYTPTKEMKNLMLKLRKNHKVIVFSDNVRERFDYLEKKYEIRKDFDELVLSFKAGFNKREPGFYKVLLKKIGCRPEESILIDNNQYVLKTAKRFGIKTILFKNPKQLKADLRKFGVRA